MRTTLDLDPTVLAAARSKARSEGTSLGRAVSELALRGLRNRDATVVRGFPVLASAPGHVLTDDDVERLLDED